jgi:hypothetical protein
MRFGILAAVALTAAATCSATRAQAGEWCGYSLREKSVIECGYSSVAECQNAVGKGGMCFVDPDTASLSQARCSPLPRRFRPQGRIRRNEAPAK